MATNRSPERKRKKPPEPWRIERMVQRVPAHLDEESNFSPWLVVGAVAVVALVGGLLLFFSGLPNTGSMANTPEVRTRTPRPTTVIVVTATPPANTATPTRKPTPYMVQYTVKSGDTLSTIAQRFNVTVDQIRDANNLNSDIIRPGEVLLIPQPTPTPKAQAGGPSPTPEPSETPTALAYNTPTLIPVSVNQTSVKAATPTPTSGVVLYYVQTGDNLGSIAKAFSTTVEAIMSLNKMSNTNIRAGQAISVPVGAWTPTATPTIHFEPTVTLTPEFTYSAPILLTPGQGARVSSAVNFQWTAVGVLEADEYYVLSLRYGDGDNETTRSYNAGQSTTYRLSEAPAGDGAVELTWYVIVVRSSGCGPASPAAVQPCAVSPPSEQRMFVWQ